MTSVVSIVGGHGKIALRLARVLSSSGSHKVHSIIRSQDHAQDIKATAANPVVMSLEDDPAAKFTEFFEQTKTNVVVFSAGAGGKGGPERTKKVDYEGAVKIFDAIEGVTGEKPRLILVSAVDNRDLSIVPDHYTAKDVEASKSVHEGALKNYYHWKYEADKDLVKRTAFQWTILRPGFLLDDAGLGTAHIGKSNLDATQIARDDVATALAVLVDRPDAAGLSLDMTSGKTPIAEGIDTAVKNRVDAWVG
ncbi:hypothetical protein EIP91_010445 [Steccherinum ochraceum]|uniref:NAD(P)-binding domain-containing protein n=1 Tax=Steccherinum ochraceum TaxID=92696 RepID=A0A4R0R2S9_9APHY|nr:hypothetical protein EIP91_010445 [Steccherinum ochraceum]